MKKTSIASNKYNKENTKTYLIRLNINTDSDLIRWMDSQKNKNGYIRKLIVQDLIQKMG